MKSYYGKNIPGQYQGVLSRPSVGLNNYTPAIDISDNHLSDMLDATPYKSSGMEIKVKPSISEGLITGHSENGGMILEAVAIQGKSVLNVSEQGYALLVYSSSESKWYIKRVDDKEQEIYSYQITDDILPTQTTPATDFRLYNFSSCNFHTEATSFICFTCEESKYLVVFDYVNKKIKTISLPFSPKKIISHASRVFCIDINNILWWCRAGDLHSWYGVEYNDTMLKGNGMIANGEYALTGQPDVTRPITFTVTKYGDLDTLGSVKIEGIDIQNQEQIETVVLSEGRVQSLRSYKTINKITQTGHAPKTTTDEISIGVAPISGGYITDDAGFWTIEREKTLTDICVMSNNLFIFAPDNIYVFRGYSPESFTLNQVIVDMGIKQPLAPRKWLTTVNNQSYFYNNGKVYEFNGYDYPKEISHLIYVNGALTNGVMGGICEISTDFNLVSDSDNLYIYNATSAKHDNNYIYMFNTRYRTWWKRSGFSANNSIYTGNDFYMTYTAMASADALVSFITVEATPEYFDMHYDIGHKGNFDPFIITKAFNTNPSEIGTLTNVILRMQGVADSTSNIYLLYSTTMDGDDFKEFKSFVPYTFNGDVENVDIPVPISYIANANHYRIKVIFSNDVILYNFERRFRVRGYTR